MVRPPRCVADLTPPAKPASYGMLSSCHDAAESFYSG